MDVVVAIPVLVHGHDAPLHISKILRHSTRVNRTEPINQSAKYFVHHCPECRIGITQAHRKN